MPFPMIPFVASALTYVFREIVVKFVVFASVFALVAFLVPFAVRYLGGFASPAAFLNAFSQIDSSVWYLLRFFRLDYGVPLIISAYVSRFLIRRLPIIG